MTTTSIQRVENGAITVAIVLVALALGQPWWALLAAFLVFDLSALGYLHGPRLGAATYNAVHNYAGPALAASVYATLLLLDRDVAWIALVATTWAFHVAVDRALGYGLKLDDFAHTHLGPIGRSRDTAPRPEAPATGQDR